MSRNGSGTYSLPSGNPVVTGTTISSTTHNNTMTDIATAITGSLAKNGETVITGDLDFNANNIIRDLDGDTYDDHSTDDQIDKYIGGALDFQYLANIFRAASGSVIETNTINETTSGSGVTIDGVLLKDSEVVLATGETLSAANDEINIKIGGTSGVRIGQSTTNTGAFMIINPPALTATASTNFGRLRVANAAAVTVPAGTTAVAASLFVEEPNLTATGTITNAATVYIQAAPTEGGTGNFALLVEDGVSAFDASIMVGKRAEDSGATAGTEFDELGRIYCTASGVTPLLINRLSDDGQLISFSQAGTAEGNISVSGTTVSLTGAHLARWSQLPSKTRRKAITRGTIMASVDEMCEWKEDVYIEDGKTLKRAHNPGDTQRGQIEIAANEQLVRCDVSTAAGDKRVYGIFDRWDEEGDYDDDFYIACTGDFPILVTGAVKGGDLLESAGDGTAKAQKDDIVRSSTIGKASISDSNTGVRMVPCQLLIG